MHIHNEIVPKSKFEDWNRVLLETGGEYLRPPKEDKNNTEWLRVDYKPGDLKALMFQWDKIFISPEVKRINQKKMYFAKKRFKVNA